MSFSKNIGTSIGIHEIHYITVLQVLVLSGRSYYYCNWIISLLIPITRRIL